MLQIYDRYITKTMTKLMLLVIVMLTVMLLLSQSLRFIDYMANSSVRLSDFGIMISLLIPWIVQTIIPIACYISCITCFYRIIQDHELPILRSIGLSNLRIAQPMIFLAIILIIISYIMSLWFVPATLKKFKDKQWYNRESYSSLLLKDGHFQMPVKNIMIYIDKKNNENSLEGIFVYDSRNPDEEIIIMAHRAAIKVISQGVILELYDGNRQAKNLTTGKLQILNFQKYPLDLGEYNNPSARLHIEPQEMNIVQLIKLTIGEEKSEQLVAKHHKLFYELQYRLSWPLLSGLFILIACKASVKTKYRRKGIIKNMILYSIMSATLLGLILGLYSITSLVAFSWLAIYVLIFGTAIYILKTL